MNNPAPGVLVRSRSAAPPGWLLAATAALIGGGIIAWLAPLGALQQGALVVGAGLALPALLLFLARPYVALAAYLLVLPLLVEVPVAAGLNAGEALTLFIMVLGALTLWGVRYRLGASIHRLRPILVPLAVLTAVSLISLMVNGIFRFEEIGSALFKIMAFALVPLLVHVHVRDAAQAKLVLGGLVLGGGAVAVYTLLSYLMGWSYSAEYNWNRPVGTFEHWNLLGGFMALVSLPTLGFAASSRGVRRLALAVLFGLEIMVLLVSLTLGSMAGVIIGSALVLVFLTKPRWSRLLPILLLAGIATTAAFATDPLLREKVTRIDERLDDRLRTYATGVMMFADKFWWGFGSEQVIADEILVGEADYGLTIFGPSTVIPHNAFLKISVEKGVFGLLAFSLLILGALRVMFRERKLFAGSRVALLYYGLVAGLLAFLVQNMTNDLLLHARLGIIFFSLVAIVDRLAPSEATG